MLDSKGFDLWSNEYDNSVNIIEGSNNYPFAGYKDVLNYIYKQIKKKDSASVLDIGFGTGVLTTKLYSDGYEVNGIDFSSNMIEIAKQKMPEATLIKWDFSKGLPDEITNKSFDFIISTYAIHHLRDNEKIDFINLISSLLNKGGVILIGDVSFETREELEECKEKYSEYWDDDEIYFIAQEIKKNLNDKYLCEYIKISHCAGVLVISNK